MAVQVAAEEDVPLTFGRLLRGHRTRVGLTQRELADLSTISVRAIRDLEQGKARRPRPDTVRLIADGLRLGRQARVDLELAADHGRRAGVLRPDYDADIAVPPVADAAIVGRTPEIEVLVAELAGGHRRLVDLVGLCGVGKTRLALEVARRVHPAMPVLWASAPGTAGALHPPIRDDVLAALLRECLADVFGPAGPERTTATGDLAELVGDRATLLVIDGITACRPQPARITRLLHDAPGLRILLTSAPPCALPGEWTYLVTPPADAETLFTEHARRATADPALDLAGAEIHEICALLDGLPTAMVAAASWLSVYDIDRVLGALRTDPAALLEHISPTEQHGDPRAGLARCVRDLSTAGRRLVTRLHRFTLDDVVAATGRSLPEAGRLVRDLLSRGVVCADHDGGHSSFRVPNLVRAVLRDDQA